MAADGALHTLGLRLKKGSPFISYLVVKKHTGVAEEQADRAIFVAGLPLAVDEDTLRDICSCFGAVDQIVLHPTKISGTVVFVESSAATSLLRHASQGELVEYHMPETDSAVGLKAWVQEHKRQRPGNAVLQQQLDDWIEHHEQQEEQRQRAREAAMSEDGWTVVVRGKGRKRAKQSGGVATVSGGVPLAAATAMHQQQKSEQAPLLDFYRFQRREARRSELHDLRAKFEQDKRRVAQMRAARNFRPF